MTVHNTKTRQMSRASLMATGLVVLGVLLTMFVGREFLVVAALGAFGPGVLRELGWLEDQDEFQRQAARRAGYLAYLAAGTAATLVIAALNWGPVDDGPRTSTWVEFVLLIAWQVWIFVSVLSYWGPEKTATRLLLVFGSFWAAFVILGHLPTTLVEAGLEVLAVAPFFILAWAASRSPRIVGGLLLGLSGFLFWYLFDMGREFIRWPSQIETFQLLVVPLLASRDRVTRRPPRRRRGRARRRRARLEGVAHQGDLLAAGNQHVAGTDQNDAEGGDPGARRRC